MLFIGYSDGCLCAVSGEEKKRSS